MTFDNESNAYALSDCAWWDSIPTGRPWWARKDCSGRVGDTEHGVMCEEHYNAIPDKAKEIEEIQTLLTGDPWEKHTHAESYEKGTSPTPNGIVFISVHCECGYEMRTYIDSVN